MARASRFLKPRFLMQEDVEKLSDEQQNVAITGFKVVRIANEERLVLFFKGIDKGLPLNQTNLETVITIHGGDDETGHWIGTVVHLYVDPDVVFQDQQVGGIRIEAVQEKPASRLFGGRT